MKDQNGMVVLEPWDPQYDGAAECAAVSGSSSPPPPPPLLSAAELQQQEQLKALLMRLQRMVATRDPYITERTNAGDPEFRLIPESVATAATQRLIPPPPPAVASLLHASALHQSASSGRDLSTLQRLALDDREEVDAGLDNVVVNDRSLVPRHAYDINNDNDNSLFLLAGLQQARPSALSVHLIFQQFESTLRKEIIEWELSARMELVLRGRDETLLAERRQKEQAVVRMERLVQRHVEDSRAVVARQQEALIELEAQHRNHIGALLDETTSAYLRDMKDNILASQRSVELSRSQARLELEEGSTRQGLLYDWAQQRLALLSMMLAGAHRISCNAATTATTNPSVAADSSVLNIETKTPSDDSLEFAAMKALEEAVAAVDSSWSRSQSWKTVPPPSLMRVERVEAPTRAFHSRAMDVVPQTISSLSPPSMVRREAYSGGTTSPRAGAKELMAAPAVRSASPPRIEKRKVEDSTMVEQHHHRDGSDGRGINSSHRRPASALEKKHRAEQQERHTSPPQLMTNVTTAHTPKVTTIINVAATTLSCRSPPIQRPSSSSPQKRIAHSNANDDGSGAPAPSSQQPGSRVSDLGSGSASSSRPPPQQQQQQQQVAHHEEWGEELQLSSLQTKTPQRVEHTTTTTPQQHSPSECSVAQQAPSAVPRTTSASETKKSSSLLVVPPPAAGSSSSGVSPMRGSNKNVTVKTCTPQAAARLVAKNVSEHPPHAKTNTSSGGGIIAHPKPSAVTFGGVFADGTTVATPSKHSAITSRSAVLVAPTRGGAPSPQQPPAPSSPPPSTRTLRSPAVPTPKNDSSSSSPPAPSSSSSPPSATKMRFSSSSALSGSLAKQVVPSTLPRVGHHMIVATAPAGSSPTKNQQQQEEDDDNPTDENILPNWQPAATGESTIFAEVTQHIRHHRATVSRLLKSNAARNVTPGVGGAHSSPPPHETTSSTETILVQGWMLKSTGLHMSWQHRYFSFSRSGRLRMSLEAHVRHSKPVGGTSPQRCSSPYSRSGSITNINNDNDNKQQQQRSVSPNVQHVSPRPPRTGWEMIARAEDIIRVDEETTGGGAALPPDCHLSNCFHVDVASHCGPRLADVQLKRYRFCCYSRKERNAWMQCLRHAALQIRRYEQEGLVEPSPLAKLLVATQQGSLRTLTATNEGAEPQ